MRHYLAAALAALVAGCDFTPVLDIATPAFEPALVLSGVLAADSTVEVSITAAIDPYGTNPIDRGTDDVSGGVPDGLTAEILRDGVSLGALRRVSRPCSSDPYSNARPDPPLCETMVSDVVTEAGGHYTVRAQAPGFPQAQATVAVPERVAVSLTRGASQTTGPRTDTDLTVAFQDPPAPGQRYALMVVSGAFSFESRVVGLCLNDDCTQRRDTTFTYTYDRRPLGYTTTDPILLAGARTIPSTGINFVTFPDDSFNGQHHAFQVRARQFQHPGQRDPAPIAGAWVVSIDDRTFGAYQIDWFSLGDENPLQEPVSLPSNVEGGYGLLGAVAIAEALLDF